MGNNNGKPDLILLITAGLILLFGFIIFVSVSMAKIAASAESPESLNLTYFLIRQFLYGLLPGLVIAFGIYKTPIEWWDKISPYLLFASLGLVAAVFIPSLNMIVRGAKRWIQIGGITFQPSELLKLTFILYLASWLTSKNIKKSERVFSKTLIAFIIICSLISGLMLSQPDLSTLIVIIAIGFVMYFIYETPLKHMAIIGLGGITSLSIFIATSSYRLERIKSMIGAGSNPEELSYQAYQALVAIGSGGLWGLGLGMGHQKYGFLPFAMSDSILAIYAEETGFIGVILLITLFTILFWRGMKIAKTVERPFLSLVAMGISFWIFFQAFIHIGSMSGLLPITGIPLPLISHGRTHLVTELAGLAILLNISKYTS